MKGQKQILEDALKYVEKGVVYHPQNLDIRLWSAIIKGGYVINQNFFASYFVFKNGC